MIHRRDAEVAESFSPADREMAIGRRDALPSSTFFACFATLL
jgi:hypothetical protein